MTRHEHVKLETGDFVLEGGEVGEALSYNPVSHRWKVRFASGERDVLPRYVRVLTYKDGYQEGLAEKDWEWRSTLWAGHGCNSAGLYGDDGELQCNNLGCGLDFKRDTPKKIAKSIAQSLVKQREREIVEWLKAYSSEHLAINRMPQAAIVGLEAWLEGR